MGRSINFLHLLPLRNPLIALRTAYLRLSRIKWLLEIEISANRFTSKMIEWQSALPNIHSALQGLTPVPDRLLSDFSKDDLGERNSHFDLIVVLVGPILIWYEFRCILNASLKPLFFHIIYKSFYSMVTSPCSYTIEAWLASKKVYVVSWLISGLIMYQWTYASIDKRLPM